MGGGLEETGEGPDGAGGLEPEAGLEDETVAEGFDVVVVVLGVGLVVDVGVMLGLVGADAVDGLEGGLDEVVGFGADDCLGRPDLA